MPMSDCMWWKACPVIWKNDQYRQIDLAIVFQKIKSCWSARPILEEQLSDWLPCPAGSALPDNPITPEQLAGIPLIMPSGDMKTARRSWTLSAGTCA